MTFIESNVSRTPEWFLDGYCRDKHEDQFKLGSYPDDDMKVNLNLVFDAETLHLWLKIYHHL